MSKESREEVKRVLIRKLGSTCRVCGKAFESKGFLVIEDPGYFSFKLPPLSQWTYQNVEDFWPGMSLVCEDCKEEYLEEALLEAEIHEMANEETIFQETIEILLDTQ